MRIFHFIKRHARRCKLQMHALAIAYRDPRMPWYAKVFAGLVIAYALSPIDLIPDFIPILGYLDDLVILPLGILLALRMIPAQVLADSREKAGSCGDIPFNHSKWGAVIIIALWGLGCAAGVYCILRYRSEGWPKIF